MTPEVGQVTISAELIVSVTTLLFGGGGIAGLFWRIKALEEEVSILRKALAGPSGLVAMGERVEERVLTLERRVQGLEDRWPSAGGA
tara:strand:+ start:819 stop:1079 length:261 start_codon:yes stop_codon:yes gene_type:complete